MAERNNMKKQNKMAKVYYNPYTDSFELWINTDGKWGFCCSSKCQALKEGQETTHIHFGFLKEVLKCIKLGYTVFED